MRGRLHSHAGACVSRFPPCWKALGVSQSRSGCCWVNVSSGRGSLRKRPRQQSIYSLLNSSLIYVSPVRWGLWLRDKVSLIFLKSRGFFFFFQGPLKTSNRGSPAKGFFLCFEMARAGQAGLNSTVHPRLTLNSQFSWPHLRSARITDLCHCT